MVVEVCVCVRRYVGKVAPLVVVLVANGLWARGEQRGRGAQGATKQSSALTTHPA